MSAWPRSAASWAPPCQRRSARSCWCSNRPMARGCTPTAAMEELRLAQAVAEWVQKGHVLIPAFALGRAQEVILILRAAQRDGLIPEFSDLYRRSGAHRLRGLRQLPRGADAGPAQPPYARRQAVCRRDGAGGRDSAAARAHSGRSALLYHRQQRHAHRRAERLLRRPPGRPRRGIDRGHRLSGRGSAGAAAARSGRARGRRRDHDRGSHAAAALPGGQICAQRTRRWR